MHLTLPISLLLLGCTASTERTTAALTNEPPAAPRGIYVLDDKDGVNGGTRNANIPSTDHPFVTGYTLRMGWADFESTRGHYDFHVIDDIIGELPAGKRLTLMLGGNGAGEPAYIAAHATATYSYDDVTRAVPWDPVLQDRFAAFVQALGDHEVADPAAGGALVPLRDHSVLANVNLGIAGIGPIRDAFGGRSLDLHSIPGYQRSLLIPAITTSITIVTTQFPNKVVYVGMWPVTDLEPPPALWRDIRDAIVASGPKIGLFEENLAACCKDDNGNVTGFPAPENAQPLATGDDKTYALFQALQGWQTPFSDPDKTAGAAPGDGLTYALDTFGAEYVELYTSDIDFREYWPSYRAFNREIGLDPVIYNRSQ